MNIIVTGVTGFIGRHLIKKLVEENHQIMVITRDKSKIENFDWYEKVVSIQIDLHSNFELILNKIKLPEVVIHLAWSKLPNYNDLIHITENLPSDIKFLCYLVNNGVKRVIITGTCYEYGLKEGCLTEDMETNPVTAYGFAKDTLRKYLELISNKNEFVLQWLRLFYVYGEGQNSNSILSQLEYCINNNFEEFNMTHGDQLRDYLPINEVIERIKFLLLNPHVNGVINCCSGNPVSVYDFISKRKDELGSDIVLRRGTYKNTEIAPKCFWGNTNKLKDFNILK